MPPKHNSIVQEQKVVVDELLSQLGQIEEIVQEAFERVNNAFTVVFSSEEAAIDLKPLLDLLASFSKLLEENGLLALTRIPQEAGETVDIHEMARQLNDHVRQIYDARQNLQSCVHVAAQL